MCLAAFFISFILPPPGGSCVFRCIFKETGYSGNGTWRRNRAASESREFPYGLSSRRTHSLFVLQAGNFKLYKRVPDSSIRFEFADGAHFRAGRHLPRPTRSWNVRLLYSEIRAIESSLDWPLFVSENSPPLFVLSSSYGFSYTPSHCLFRVQARSSRAKSRNLSSRKILQEWRGRRSPRRDLSCVFRQNVFSSNDLTHSVTFEVRKNVEVHMYVHITISHESLRLNYVLIYTRWKKKIK